MCLLRIRFISHHSQPLIRRRASLYKGMGKQRGTLYETTTPTPRGSLDKGTMWQQATMVIYHYSEVYSRNYLYRWVPNVFAMMKWNWEDVTCPHLVLTISINERFLEWLPVLRRTTGYSLVRSIVLNLHLGLDLCAAFVSASTGQIQRRILGALRNICD